MRTSIQIAGSTGSIVEDAQGLLFYPVEIADESFDYICGDVIPDRTFTYKQEGVEQGPVTVKLTVDWEIFPTADSPLANALTPSQIKLCSAIRAEE